MAINKITFPNANQPTDLTDYQNLINVLMANTVGASDIGITEFDNITVQPEIKDNALFQIGGALFQANSDTSISGSILTGDNYIYLAVSGDTATPTFTQTAPTWDYQYNHYVTVGGDYVLPIFIYHDTDLNIIKYEVQDRFLKEMIDYLGNKKVSSIYKDKSISGSFFSAIKSTTIESTLFNQLKPFLLVDDQHYLCSGSFVSGISTTGRTWTNGEVTSITYDSTSGSIYLYGFQTIICVDTAGEGIYNWGIQGVGAGQLRAISDVGTAITFDIGIAI